METGANSRQALIFTFTNFARIRAPFEADSVSAHGGSYYYEKASVVKGHHVYKAVWTPFIGEELPVQPEYHEEHAVAVTRDGCTIDNLVIPYGTVRYNIYRRTVGDVPRTISQRHLDIAPRPHLRA